MGEPAEAPRPTAERTPGGTGPRATQRYPKRLRLCSRKGVGRIFREGRYKRLGLIHAKVLPAVGPDSAFLVSVKKKAGKAHERNRLKRLLREAIRLNRWRLQTPWEICLFVVARPARDPVLSDVEPEVRRLFESLNRASRNGSQREWGS